MFFTAKPFCSRQALLTHVVPIALWQALCDLSIFAVVVNATERVECVRTVRRVDQDSPWASGTGRAVAPRAEADHSQPRVEGPLAERCAEHTEDSTQVADEAALALLGPEDSGARAQSKPKPPVSISPDVVIEEAKLKVSEKALESLGFFRRRGADLVAETTTLEEAQISTRRFRKHSCNVGWKHSRVESGHLFWPANERVQPWSSGFCASPATSSPGRCREQGRPGRDVGAHGRVIRSSPGAPRCSMAPGTDATLAMLQPVEAFSPRPLRCPIRSLKTFWKWSQEALLCLIPQHAKCATRSGGRPVRHDCRSLRVFLESAPDTSSFCQAAQDLARAQVPPDVLTLLRMGRMTALEKPSHSRSHQLWKQQLPYSSIH